MTIQVALIGAGRIGTTHSSALEPRQVGFENGLLVGEFLYPLHNPLD